MLERIISGGQTGADRGGLEAGKHLGLATGGFVPRDCRTEIGKDTALLEFGCQETAASAYDVRTAMNVRMADATVIFSPVIHSSGTRATLACCQSQKKPYLVNPTREEFLIWLKVHKVVTLNVAGNRESVCNGIQDLVKAFLIGALTPHAEEAPVAQVAS